MLNIGSDVTGAHLWGLCPGASPSAYHPSVQTSLLYGDHFFTPRAMPEPSPMPESHSP